MEKLKEYFDGMIVKKGEQDLFSAMNIPSFLRDWILKRYANEDGSVDVNYLKNELKRILPTKDEWPSILDRMVINGEQVRFLAKIQIFIDTSKGEVRFELPDFGVSNKQTVIPDNIWNRCKEQILGVNGEIWGVIDLKYTVAVTKKQINRIEMCNFQCFRPYTIDLNYYKNARKNFSIDEWINVLLGAIDYDYKGYDSEEEKLMLLTRLLPSIENRLNLIELAPKGTGKSYLFSQINKRGWLSTGGVMTRAKLFYDMKNKIDGLVTNYDYVALDEISTIQFPNMDEMRGAMKGYMENGKYTVGIKAGSGMAGIVILGNISKDNMDIEKNMFKELPIIFKDSALIDRFHGFIEGWKIPRMKESLKIKDWALNCEYFAEIMHQLRSDITYKNLVDKIIDVPKDADTRDTAAVKRVATAYMKLFFPHWQKVEDVDLELFDKYCLSRAIRMRYIVKKQLGMMDKEFLSRPFAEYKIKKV